MQKTAQAWFGGGPSSGDLQKAPSLLADWNAYASSQDAADDSDSALGFDLEAAVRDKVSGTFNVYVSIYILYIYNVFVHHLFNWHWLMWIY